MRGWWKKGVAALLLLFLGGGVIVLFGRKETYRQGVGRVDLTYDGLYLKQVSVYINDERTGLFTMPPKTVFFWNAYSELNRPRHLWPENYLRPCSGRKGFMYHSIVRGEDVLVDYDGNCDGIIDASVVLGPAHKEAEILLRGTDPISLTYRNVGEGFLERNRAK